MIPERSTSLSGSGDFLLSIRGTVQGVGFRPFIARLAEEHALFGWVRNDHNGVTIRLRASSDQTSTFAEAIREGAPPAALINSIEVAATSDSFHKSTDYQPVPDGFLILESPQNAGVPVAAVSADLALCEDCRRELLDPSDPRYRYPFINCTNCGPRYTIVKELPYDRARTTMADFAMCPSCEQEYKNVRNRRYHTQPNACPECGPQIQEFDADGNPSGKGEDALKATTKALQGGQITAVKGLGGFHLFVDACNDEAVNRLRIRKNRDQKPLAVMFRDFDQLNEFAEFTEAEWSLLKEPASPIVLVRQREATSIASNVAPGNPWIGALLPYTPLHVLLMEAVGRPLVATSANLSEEPICTAVDEAVERLRGIADRYLVHNRPIARAVDDSVIRFSATGPIILRRARGYAPAPLLLPKGAWAESPILSLGGHLKSTIAITMADQVIVSPHIGDLSNAASISAFRKTIELLSGLYGGNIQQVTCDLHPDYASTRFAESLGLPVFPVQHHLAHVLACLLEHGGGPDKVLGVSWDGTGYGTDGTIWGGEFILVDRKDMTARRLAHLRSFPLPGGERAIRQTGRSALGALYASGRLNSVPCRNRLLSALGKDSTQLDMLVTAMDRRLNSPITSSAGRLFDAVAGLLGICETNHFEGQAGMSVEIAASGSAKDVAEFSYHLCPSDSGTGTLEIDWAPTLEELCSAMETRVPVSVIAMGFHKTLARMVVDIARHFGIHSVVLTGGCFQNALLTELTSDALRRARFNPLLHKRLSPNDNSIAAGQALAAIWNVRL